MKIQSLVVNLKFVIRIVLPDVGRNSLRICYMKSRCPNAYDCGYTIPVGPTAQKQTINFNDQI